MDGRDDVVTVPTACTLDTDHARRRVARWHALSERAQPTVTQPGPDIMQVHYPMAPGVIAELTRLAALEAECCGLLTFAVQEAGHEVILTVEPAAGGRRPVPSPMSRSRWRCCRA